MKRRAKLPSPSPARQRTALRRTTCFTLTCALAITVCPALDRAHATATEGRPPNIVLIMTDNHGAWTLGCYGNPEIRTPHIDRLAASGAKFNHVYANNGVCADKGFVFDRPDALSAWGTPLHCSQRDDGRAGLQHD